MGNPRHHAKRRTERKLRSCKSKIRYPNQMVAMHAAVKTGMTWYHCHFCKGWHLTKDRDPLAKRHIR